MYKIAEELVTLCQKRSLTIATAESLTGGLIGSCITSIPGSSQIYLGGIISYTNEAKAELLSVSVESLNSDGAVSERVAREMATGAREALCADYAVAVTGIAGPGGEEPDKPVGTVYIALASPRELTCKRHLFSGTRDEVRCSTACEALEAIIKAINTDLE